MVRFMKNEDQEAILEILASNELFTPEEKDAAWNQIQVYLKHPRVEDYLIAVVEDKERDVVGFCSFGLNSITKGTFYLYWIAISPVKQMQGFGRELVCWVESRIENMGGRLIIVETSSREVYSAARKFYEALGFQKVSSLPNYYDEGDDQLIYAKYLLKRGGNEWRIGKAS